MHPTASAPPSRPSSGSGGVGAWGDAEAPLIFGPVGCQSRTLSLSTAISEARCPESVRVSCSEREREEEEERVREERARERERERRKERERERETAIERQSACPTLMISTCFPPHQEVGSVSKIGRNSSRQPIPVLPTPGSSRGTLSLSLALSLSLSLSLCPCYHFGRFLSQLQMRWQARVLCHESNSRPTGVPRS